MRRIFGAKKEVAPAPTLDETTDRLDVRGNRADDKISQLDAQLTKFKEQIKRTRPGPAQNAIKRRALQVLKQKRLYEGQREQLYQQQFNVEQTKFTVDNIKDTVGTVQAMKGAAKEMKGQFKSQKELDISYIEKLQDDMFDMMDIATEINDAMGRSYNVPEDVDESDLMAELDALEDDLGAEELADGGPSYLQEPESNLPEAPTEEARAESELGLPAIKS